MFLSLPAVILGGLRFLLVLHPLSGAQIFEAFEFVGARPGESTRGWARGAQAYTPLQPFRCLSQQEHVRVRQAAKTWSRVTSRRDTSRCQKGNTRSHIRWSLNLLNTTLAVTIYQAARRAPGRRRKRKTAAGRPPPPPLNPKLWPQKPCCGSAPPTPSRLPAALLAAPVCAGSGGRPLPPTRG